MAVQPITVQMPPPPQLQWWEVQGVLPSIAAVIAVIGTAASLHWNTSRNLKAARKSTDDQLEHARAEAQQEREHASEQARRDRIIEARKSVYGDLIDSYAQVQEIMGRLPQLDTENAEALTKPLLDMGASVSKSWIWGEVETVKQVREFHAQVSEMFLEALARCYPISTKQKLIRLLEVDATKAEAKHQQILEALEHAERNRLVGYFQGQEDQQRIAADAQFDKASNLRQQIFQLNSELENPIRAYQQFVVDEQAKRMVQINKVMAAARAELGLQGDAAILEAQSAEMSARAASAFAKLNARLREPSRSP